mmetsp:Transcript_16552/g.29873  ORF Transcript_16552/g.29873 Transcript_16552/m.29873 type:complete len:423 (+) Transcript_16552:709-1977(+)
MVGRRRLLPPRRQAIRRDVQSRREGTLRPPHASAQRHGTTPHGPRHLRRSAGRPRQISPHARPSRAVDSRNRSRRHSDAAPGGEAARVGGEATGHRRGDRPRGRRRRRKGQAGGSRGILGTRVGVQGGAGGSHHLPTAFSGCQRRLDEGAFHHGSGVERGSLRGVLSTAREGIGVQGHVHGQLESGSHDGRERPRGGVHRGGGEALLLQVSGRERRRGGRAGGRRGGVPGRGDDQARDHFRRHGRVRQPRGRSVRAPRRQARARAHVGFGRRQNALHPHHRRRLRRHGIRNRRPQNHPRTRPQRLRNRQKALPRNNERDEQGRDHEFQRRREVRGSRSLRGPREALGGHGGEGVRDQGRAAHAARAAIAARGGGHRAVGEQAVVREDGGDGGQGVGGRQGRGHSDCAAEVREGLVRLADRHS